MIDVIHYPLFIITAVTLNLYPGPDTIYILTRSTAQGRAAGVASALGISSGCVIHALLGALGLAAVVMASATAYQMIKWAGAVYLVYLGLTMLRAYGHDAAHAVSTKQSTGRIYVQGVITSLLNPKVALFFLALIPQFIAPSAAHPGLSFLALGLTFVATSTLWSLVLAMAAGAFHRRLASGPGARWLKRLGGGLLIGLGARLAFSK
ncbi:LysE family translocator [Desulfomicrobium baculatum]|uniref:Lysine exporter protein (LYSE/YGGA) n=1 Tax=Desulfomicrobium baculatum (strain DSM 4028 / VKM B-1378 / X) TaxID=525897 RepID=C7LWU2_DESBD|nr:LysE family translocator [Desulfomicrobium baculatum]ACU91152.1 Lysine exporter protein (LYSE/YGGA) [Desulfomicrobium baculatum DSM 4028]